LLALLLPPKDEGAIQEHLEVVGGAFQQCRHGCLLQQRVGAEQVQRVVAADHEGPTICMLQQLM
jgi:hypothetical protein